MEERETAQPRSTMDRVGEYRRSRSLEASGRHLIPYLSTAKRREEWRPLGCKNQETKREIFRIGRAVPMVIKKDRL
jgi:hypothetical protein